MTEIGAGTVLAGYRLERLLGRGGMGTVWLATQEALDRKVALKLLAPEISADPKFRARFLSESRLAASIDHPNIVPVFEAGEADGELFLAMRYVEGTDLDSLIASEGALAPGRIVRPPGGDRRRARRGPRPWPRPSRRQALQHPRRARPARRARIPERLRADQAPRLERRPDADGPGHRLGRLPRAGGHRGRLGRPSGGHLLARLRALRRAVRASTLRARHRSGRPLGARQGRATDAGARAPGAGAARPGHRPSAGQGPRGALRFGGRAHRCRGHGDRRGRPARRRIDAAADDRRRGPDGVGCRDRSGRRTRTDARSRRPRPPDDRPGHGGRRRRGRAGGGRDPWRPARRCRPARVRGPSGSVGSAAASPAASAPSAGASPGAAASASSTRSVRPDYFDAITDCVTDGGAHRDARAGSGRSTRRPASRSGPCRRPAWLEHLPAWAPDGRRFYFAASPPEFGVGIWQASSDGSGATSIVSTDGGPRAARRWRTMAGWRSSRASKGPSRSPTPTGPVRSGCRWRSRSSAAAKRAPRWSPRRVTWLPDGRLAVVAGPMCMPMPAGRRRRRVAGTIWTVGPRRHGADAAGGADRRDLGRLVARRPSDRL